MSEPFPVEPVDHLLKDRQVRLVLLALVLLIIRLGRA